MDKNGDIYKAAGIIIKERRLLVEKDFDKEYFVSPGGKIEEGETPKQALIRELDEEFKIKVNEADLKEFGHYHAPASGQEERTVHMSVFLVNKYQGKISKGHKVEKIVWLTSIVSKDIKIGSIFEHEVIPELKSRNLID